MIKRINIAITIGIIFAILLGISGVINTQALYLGDFPGIYILGYLLKDNPTHLYDLPLQQTTENILFPSLNGSFNPSLYPPWSAVILGFLAFFDQKTAHIVWIIFNCICWILAIYLIDSDKIQRKNNLYILPSTLLFCPVLISLMGSQNSGFTVFIIAGAIYFIEKLKFYISGIFISLLLYKPQFAVFLIPSIYFFINLRKDKTLFFIGVTTGIISLSLISIYFFNGAQSFYQIYLSWLRNIKYFDSVNLSINHLQAVSIRGFIEEIFLVLNSKISEIYKSYLNLISVLMFAFLVLRINRLNSFRFKLAGILLLLPAVSPQCLYYDLSIGLLSVFLLNFSLVKKQILILIFALFSFNSILLFRFEIPFSFYITYLGMIYLLVKTNQETPLES